MIHNYKFEKIYSEIEPIPLSAQYRMDCTGVKLNLETWNGLSKETQALFCNHPVRTKKDQECYRAYILYLLKRKRRGVLLLDPDQINGDKAQWENLFRIPDKVYQMAVDLNYTLSPQDWLKLSDFKRYILFKLAQGIHSTDYLKKALAEVLRKESKISSLKSNAENYQATVGEFVS
ncbi:MAG TPA: nitrate reductase associated protein [bacterium]|jgi:hypothetical protein|nr:nitrate reductase associated protein [bacterium]